MEKLTLTSVPQEIIVNNGASDGAADIFSYGPDDPASRPLGSLFIIGHRDTDSSNMGYMVSLIAALARREYYAQSGQSPRDAFARALRKTNEVVDEFFKANSIALSVGIIAIAGGTILVSKLDKFKILLARDNQVIDILNNVLLFSREQLEKRRFSSLISGSVQVGDRILAFIPTKGISVRERSIKQWLVHLPADDFAEKIVAMGKTNGQFGAALLHIRMAHATEPATIPSPQPRELEAPVVLAAIPTPQTSPAWMPRQQQASPPPAEAEATEVPHIIPAEFSLGRRRSSFSRLFSGMRIVRLDGRGKAIALAAAAAVVIGGALIAKSILFVSPQEQKLRQAMQDIRSQVQLAQTKISQHESLDARHILGKALADLSGYDTEDRQVSELVASITGAMDTLDRAQSVSPTLAVQPQSPDERLTLATWASPSQSVWVVGVSADGAYWSAPTTDGIPGTRVAIGNTGPLLLTGWRNGVLAVDPFSRSIIRIAGGGMKAFSLPTPETILDAVQYEGNLYVLTDRSLLKISDLDTDKPITKQWLAAGSELAEGATRLWVDGSVYTMSRDGTLTTYYKGKRSTQSQVESVPSGTWWLLGGPTSDTLAIANADTKRVSLFSVTTGTLTRTMKLDTAQVVVHMSVGPSGSFLVTTKDGKVWKLQ